jgi:hypothetical protein
MLCEHFFGVSAVESKLLPMSIALQDHANAVLQTASPRSPQRLIGAGLFGRWCFDETSEHKHMPADI